MFIAEWFGCLCSTRLFQKFTRRGKFVQVNPYCPNLMGRRLHTASLPVLREPYEAPDRFFLAVKTVKLPPYPHRFTRIELIRLSKLVE